MEKPCRIAILGAGGKTTTMLNLARQLANAGNTVLCFTTTHMEAFAWHGAVHTDQAEAILHAREASLPNTADSLFPFPRGMVLAGSTAEGSRGMRGLSEQTLREVGFYGTSKEIFSQNPNLAPCSQSNVASKANSSQCFDYYLYEADGSRNHPIKYPASYEPVLLPQTDLLIVCMGLSAIGKPLGEFCHRHELLPFAVNEDESISTELAGRILLSGYGHFPTPTMFLLNQADSSERLCQAEELAFKLKPFEVYITSYPENFRNPR